jgi:hypothetical protein
MWRSQSTNCAALSAGWPTVTEVDSWSVLERNRDTFERSGNYYHWTVRRHFAERGVESADGRAESCPKCQC